MFSKVREQCYNIQHAVYILTSMSKNQNQNGWDKNMDQIPFTFIHVVLGETDLHAMVKKLLVQG